MRILLAVDGSENALRAVRGLIDHVRKLRDPVHVDLVFVHPPVPLAFATQHVDPQILDGYYRDEGQTALREAAAALTTAGVAFTPHIHVGEIAETLVELAGQFGCELICMGTHGRGTVSGMLLGSVARKVLHLTSLPVLLVR